MSWRDGAVLVECVAIVLLPLPDTNPAPPDVIYRNGVVLTMEGGLCYRFFAVADGTVEKLTIRVERPTGAFVSQIQAKEPVAILDARHGIAFEADQTLASDDSEPRPEVVEDDQGNGRQQQHPQQRVPVIRSQDGVRGDPRGIVVGKIGEQSGPEHREKRQGPAGGCGS